jgi:hypothetical protein
MLTLFCEPFSAVGIQPGCGSDDRGFGVRVPVELFTPPYRRDRFWGPLNLLSNGYGALSLGVKRQGLEADQSPPTSAQVKKTWVYISTLPYARLENRDEWRRDPML